MDLTKMTARTPIVLSILMVAMLSACGSLRQTADDPGPVAVNPISGTPVKGSAEELYADARRSLDKRQYETSIEKLERLEATHPFGDFTAQAQLDIAYAYYKQTEYDSASATIDRYLRLYPRHDNADYAHYLLGLVYFSTGKSLLDSVVSRKLHQIDQASVRDAFASFATMTRKFPDSPYVDDAKERMEVLRNAMAQHELSTARYYYSRSAMIAVINRVNYMIEQYRDTSYTNDGLALMAQAHGALGNLDLARATVLMLEQSDPDHPELGKLRKYRS
jgi:outer membrane protein assembly factor BamD